MSRSLGDRIAHSVGVSSAPEVGSFILKEEDKVILLASDGVWEFLTNEDVLDIVVPFYDKNAPEAAANSLVKTAIKKWK